MNYQTLVGRDANLANKIHSQGSFLTVEDVDALEKIDRMAMVLVRCNMGRFLTPVQNVKHFTRMIDEHFKFVEKAEGHDAAMQKSDWVRDISIPTF